jgi:peroxiredoxin
LGELLLTLSASELIKIRCSKLWKKLASILILTLILVTGCSKIQGSVPAIDSKVNINIPDLAHPIISLSGFGVGELAPDFSYWDSAGNLNSVISFRGKPILLNFWSSSCPPCRAEMPLFEKVYRDQSWRDKGLQVLTVNLDEDPKTASKFVSDSGYTFPFLLDSKQAIGNAYNIFEYPSTFFIDRDGIVQARKEGSFSNSADLEKALNLIVH